MGVEDEGERDPAEGEERTRTLMKKTLAQTRKMEVRSCPQSLGKFWIFCTMSFTCIHLYCPASQRASQKAHMNDRLQHVRSCLDVIHVLGESMLLRT